MERGLLDQTNSDAEKKPKLFLNKDDEERDNIDLILVIGGDGTVL